MNILYISKLTGNLWAGPNNSVPAQVEAQSKIDNVFWYNLNKVKRQEWVERGIPVYNMEDYPSGRLKDLPSPFDKPDIVVVEEVYCHPFSKLIHDVQKAKIPYVVIPRSTLTEKAQQHHRWKKIIGNFIYFNKMLRKAAGIQYLTEKEFNESGEKWNKNAFVIPNGIIIPNKKKTTFNSGRINATYIGRYELYQKGLDLLLEGIYSAKDELRESNFKLSMYGVDQEGSIKKMEKIISQYGISDLVTIHGSVVGKEKEKILLDSDVFIMTSRFEGFSMGLIEALSYGIPCVVSEGTNIADEVFYNKAGWKCKCNAEDIKRALINVVNDRNDLFSYGDFAELLSQNYRWENIAIISRQKYLEFNSNSNN